MTIVVLGAGALGSVFAGFGGHIMVVTIAGCGALGSLLAARLIKEAYCRQT